MKNLSIFAKIYIFGIILLGGSLAIYEFIGTTFQDPALVLVVAVLASLAQVYKVEGSTDKTSYNVAWIAYGFSIVLFNPSEALFVIIFAHVVEWLRHRYPWYIQAFNIATFILASELAFTVALEMNLDLTEFNTLAVFGVVASLAVFTFVNHLLVGVVIYFARKQNFKESGVFGFLTLMIDFTVIGLGAAAAFLWMITPLAAAFALIPIYMIYTTLRMPSLERQTEIDPKTELYNPKFMEDAFQKELNRARKFDRPLTFVMADLDHLHNINNTYGHMAGDIVLIGIAKIFKEHFGGYDIVARFGGEEFAIIMPETTPEEAYPRVEQVRKAIQETQFEVSTSVTPIQATMSFGISWRTEQFQSPEEIIHNADLALYHAKNEGRNRTALHSEEGLQEFFGLGQAQVSSREVSSTPKIEKIRAATGKRPGTYQTESPGKEKAKSKAPASNASTAQYTGILNWFIIFTGLLSIALTAFVMEPPNQIDWFGLSLFALCVVLAEVLALDIYSRDASVSTSAAPFIGAVLLFGPWGAIAVSTLLAAVALLKKKAHLRRFVFNLSNHLIAGLIVIAVVKGFGVPYVQLPQMTQIALAVLAGAIIFFSTTFFLAGVIGISLEKSLLQVWREKFQWLLIFYVGFGIVGYTLILGYNNAGLFGIMAMILPMWMIRFSHAQYISKTENLVRQLQAQNKELSNQEQEISTVNNELLACLAKAVDIRDPFTYGHSEIASHYAVILGREMGLSQERLELLRKAGLLHDIGKLGIPETILFKPASLTAEEYERIKEHPMIGARLVSQSHAMQYIVPAILHHHERWDGQGYPHRLRGEQIPLEARIIGLADAIEAMASNHPYRKGLSFEKIVREVNENSGTQFDPQVVQAFMQIVGRQGAKVLRPSVRSRVRHAELAEYVMAEK